MIAVRLLCAVGEPHTYAETAVTLDCGAQPGPFHGFQGSKVLRAGVFHGGEQGIFCKSGRRACSSLLQQKLKSAKLTAEWEDRLGAVERGELAPEDFMAGITAMLVPRLSASAWKGTPFRSPSSPPPPLCGPWS